MDKNTTMAIATVIADCLFDGHLNVMKFTTNWRVSFGDPPRNRDEIMMMPCGETFEDALCAAIEQFRKF